MRLYSLYLVTAVILLHNLQTIFGKESKIIPVRGVGKTANTDDDEGEEVSMRCHNNDAPPGRICCGGWLRHKSHGKNTACCRSVTFNNETQICCQGLRVLERQFGNFTSCCRYSYLTAAYDTRVQKCCYGTPIPKGKICSKCLAQVTGYSSYYMCCRGRQVFKRFGENSKCCGRRVYDARSQTCCAGKISRQNYGAFTKCCGEKPYDSRQNYGAFPKCCREKPYDPRQSLCCVSQYLVPKSYGNDSACCGYVGRVYSVTKEICCGGLKLYNKIHGEFTGCCRYSYLTSVYDKRDEKCCYDKATPKKQRCESYK